MAQAIQLDVEYAQDQLRYALRHGDRHAIERALDALERVLGHIGDDE